MYLRAQVVILVHYWYIFKLDKRDGVRNGVGELVEVVGSLS